MKKRFNKKAQLADLGRLGIGVATFTIIIAVTFLVLAQTGKQQADIGGFANVSVDNSAGGNATKVLTSAVADIPGWVPLIIIVAIGGLILAMVSRFGGGK